MDSYKVQFSDIAGTQLDAYIVYIQYELMNDQAAASVWSDFAETSKELEKVAGSLKFCDTPELRERGYRKIRFLHHRYVMLYKIVDGVVRVDGIYHELQDYEHIFTEMLK